MKHLTLILFGLLLFSCNKNEQPPSFSCDVNDVKWRGGSVGVGRSHDTELLTFHIYDDTLSLLFNIFADGENQYDLSPNSKHNVSVNFKAPPYIYIYKSTYELSNGDFTISEIKGVGNHTKMSGTFSFDAYNDSGEKVSFTNGTFTNYPYLK